MLLQATPPFMAKGETGGGGGASANLAAVQALFTGSEKGFIYLFADPSTMNSNSDGVSGSAPSAYGDRCRYVEDLSGTGNHGTGSNGLEFVPAGHASNFHGIPACSVSNSLTVQFTDPTFAVGQPFCVGQTFARAASAASMYGFNGTSGTTNGRVVFGYNNNRVRMNYFGNSLDTSSDTFVSEAYQRLIGHQTTTGREIYVDNVLKGSDSNTTYPVHYTGGGIGASTNAHVLAAAVGISGVRSAGDITTIDAFLADPLG